MKKIIAIIILIVAAALGTFYWKNLRGEARGNWFFEANLPVKLLDGNSKVIAQSGAQAKGEWMTTDLVPFEETLEFKNPETDTGTLVIEKDNPSGLPQHAREVRIPVRFK